MVAQLLRLKLLLLRNTFRRRPLQLVGMILGLAYGLGLATFVTVALVGLRSSTPDVARAVIITFGAFVVLAFLLLPLVFGVDDTIDPRRFALFGIPTTRLALGLLAAAAVSVPTLIVTVFAIAQIVTWTRGPLPTLIALVGAVLIVVTCVLCARVSSALAASFLASRRSRETSGIVLVLVLAIAAPLVALLSTVDWQSQGLPVVRRVAAIVSWTPFGAVWSAPGDAALGRTDLALARLAITIAFIGVLWLVWRSLVGRMLVSPQRETAGKRYTGLGWFERLPATPLGVIAARSLSYWGRDARYRVSLAVIPIVPIIMVVALMIAGVPPAIIAWVPVPVMCLFLGWTVHNDIAHDSTAFWAHVSADIRGTADRWGRVVPALAIGLPLAVVGSAITTIVIGDTTMLPGLTGLSVCVLLVALGVSSVISAAFPYPAVHPGDSPFAQPQAAGATGSVVQGVSLIVVIVLSAPVLALVILAPGLVGVQYFALGLGALIGLVALIGGILWGGHLVDRRAPELLAFTLQN